MREQDPSTLRLKANAFDRIIAKYKTLETDAGFYSKNWVEMAEVIESELKRLNLRKI